MYNWHDLYFLTSAPLSNLIQLYYLVAIIFNILLTMLNIVSSETIKQQQYNPSSPISATKVPAHNVFVIDQVIFSSNFDNGNLARVEKIPNRSYEYKIWTAPDNMVKFFSFLIVHH
jgi:hypothetical protein